MPHIWSHYATTQCSDHYRNSVLPSAIRTMRSSTVASKTGTDGDAGSVNLNLSAPGTIANLTALATPSSIPPTSRIQPTETTVWSLNATLTEFKLEGDSDVHLVLVDESGNSMIAEIPDPSCVGPGSSFASGISNARSQFSRVAGPHCWGPAL